MSDEVFPDLPGLAWGISKSPTFNTKVMKSVSGRELRASFQAVPTYQISMSFDFLREWQQRTELQELESFFLARRGAFDSFLFKMPDDNEYSCEFVGDGTTTEFQLYKTIFGMQIPILHVESLAGEADPLMWNQSNQKLMWSSDDTTLMWSVGLSYSISKNGVVTLSEPLADGQKISLTGTYYYRCRFADDEQEYNNFMRKLWKASKVEMVGSLGNKI